jgi:hypothetical protein
MAEKAQTASARPVKEEEDLTSLAPMGVGDEDAMGAEDVAKAWASMFVSAGLRNPTEREQKAFRLACYVYASKNGTSREGAYSAMVTMANGHKFSSSVVPQATGKMRIRKFFRGNMEDSYILLKGSRAMEKEARFVAKAAKLGIPADSAFAMADWLTDCPNFTPTESLAHDKSFTYSLDRSRRARDGHTLEDVEGERVSGILASQGSFNAGKDLSAF